MSHTRCDHQCAIHKPALGVLEAVQLTEYGVIHAALQNEPATLCGFHIESFEDAVFMGWWSNHTKKLCQKCGKGGVRL